MYSLSKRAILSLTVIASATVMAGRAITQDGAYAATGEHMHGVSDFNANAGDELAVDCLGVSILEAGAAIAADTLVQVGVDGKYITKAAGKAVARSMTAASADGSKFEAFLLPANS
jgi:Uncharacterized conserved protein (DUF2190)